MSDRPTTAHRLFLLVSFLAAAAACLAPRLKNGTFSAPPELGDGQDYDMIGVSLSRGFGFGYAWSDPEWRAPYVRDNQTTGSWDEILKRSGPYTPTAYRPPAFPAALSLIYRTVGRDFRVWRIVNAAVVAAAMVAAVALAGRFGGFLAALAALLLCLGDRLLISYSTQYMTDGLGAAGVIALVWAVLKLIGQVRLRKAVLAGALLGLLVLARSIFIFWYPFVVTLVWWLVVREGRSGRALAAAGLVAAAAVLVPFPWWVRNCEVLDGFMPLGTQGGINLPQGFSDLAQANGGQWTGD